jgi:hypothetical protein
VVVVVAGIQKRLELMDVDIHVYVIWPTKIPCCDTDTDQRI